MAILHVATNNANGNSGTATITVTTVAGNAVIVHLFKDGDQGANTQTAGDTLTERVSVEGSGEKTTQYTNFNVAGGSTAYTFTFTSTQWRIVVSEFSGLDPANTIDASGTTAFTSGVASLQVTASGATTTADQLLIAGFNWDTSGSTAIVSTTGNDAAAWIVPSNGSVVSGGVTEFNVCYEIVSATGTYGVTTTVADTISANAVLGTYKAAAVVAGLPVISGTNPVPVPGGRRRNIVMI